MILIGTSGYSFPDWVGPFYPPGTARGKMLEHYVLHFPAVEVNATYYRIPPPTTLQAMERKTPPGFEFVVKAHHDMTHKRSLEPDLYRSFARAIAPLQSAEKLSGILAQFPYAFRRTPENEAFLLDLRERLPRAPLFVEFRHKSWIRDDLFPWLEDQGFGYVSVDEPALPGLVPPIARATSPIGYVRLHGRNKENWWRPDSGTQDTAGAPARTAGSQAPTRTAVSQRGRANYGPLFAGESEKAEAADPSQRSRTPGDRYDYLYSESELKEWVEKIRELSTKAKKTFVFFNNCHVGQAATGAKLMRRLLEGEGLL